MTQQLKNDATIGQAELNSASLVAKIQELKAQVTELEQQSNIDITQASPQEIITNAQTNTEHRESAAYLKEAIASLEVQLSTAEKIEAQQETEKLVAQNFDELVEQAEKVTNAIASLATELQRLREMGKAINSRHYAQTGKLALDDRISRDYLLPKVEKLSKSIIIHTEVRNYL